MDYNFYHCNKNNDSPTVYTLQTTLRTTAPKNILSPFIFDRLVLDLSHKQGHFVKILFSNHLVTFLLV